MSSETLSAGWQGVTSCIFHLEAESELLTASDYFEARKPGLGNVFLWEVRQTVNEILEFPRAWSLLEANVRVKTMSRFPFSLVYREHGEHIFILSVLHQRRNPEVWRDRL